jgi:PKD repeat protein
LTVTDRDQATATVTRRVEVSRNQPPQARFTVSPGQGNTSTTFSFDGSASSDPDGRITEYRWKFGDGQSGTGVRTTHSYRSSGNFPVELAVTDNRGLTSNLQREVSVEKEQGQRCSGKGGHGPGYIFTVVSADRGSRTIIGRFQGNPGCQAHYRCGDIRKGGYPGRSPGKEYWIGTICEFYDLGGGLARMRVSGGRYWPSAGESKLYTWPQEDCSAPCR